MKQLIIICGENKVRCNEILELLRERNKGIEIILRFTTYTDDITCRVVGSNEFGDMVEQGELFEYNGYHGIYYGTPHIKEDNVNDKFMFNEVSVALKIKKVNPKATTIYIASQEQVNLVKKEHNYFDVRKLDFLVVDYDLTSTAHKIEEIVQFIEENGMKSS